MSDIVLEIKDLSTHFFTDQGEIPAVDGVTLKVKEGQVLGIVGESGCGKSVTSLSIMNLIPRPPGKIVNGEINFKGENLVYASTKRMREIRGNEIAMIFQEPMTSLDPLFTIGNQMREAIRIHEKVSKKEAQRRSIERLKKVGFPKLKAAVIDYQHQ